MDTFSKFLLASPQLPFGLNQLDLVILVIVFFYAWEGYRLGFLLALLDLVSFIASFTFALKIYKTVGELLLVYSSIPSGFADALGFFIAAFILEMIFGIVLRMIHNRSIKSFSQASVYRSYKKVDSAFGIFPGIISCLIIISFLFSLILSLPITPHVKNLINSSRIGSTLVAQTSTFEKSLNTVFGGAINETLTFLTVKPQSNETVTLRFTVSSPTIDEVAEQEMFRMVNEERTKRGLKPLMFNTALRGLARDYSKDMFQRGYFSHYNPEGESPFDRMERYGITYTHAGENLALAPSTILAMQGLMNSPGHKANILSEDFGTIGIGAMDGGIYGKMFTQEFTN